MAVHSATCQECKPCPLTGDLVGLLVEVALRDPNRRVRLHALWGLHRPQDPRAVAALKSILEEADPELQIAAYHALVSQDPTYQGDPIGLHVRVTLSDAHKSERLKALWVLRRLPQDPRARAALEQILRTETDPRLRSYAHHALKNQDPNYKAAFDAKARDQSRRYAVSILSRDQEELARHFAGKSQEGLPVPFVWRQGYPLIKGAIAYVTCQIIDVHSVGDHTLYIGKVEHLSFAEEKASLLYYGGKYL